MTSIRDLFRSAIAALAWLAAVTVIALGAAGIVAAMDGPSADGTDRSGRTVRGDALADRALDRIEENIRTLSWTIDSLGQQARVVLASLSANEPGPAEAATAVGTGLVADIEAQAEAIRGDLAEVSILHGPSVAYELSPATRTRHMTYLASLEATAGLRDAWTDLTVGSLSASRLSGLLAAHDEAVLAAAAAGRDANYDTALERLDEADTAIAQATTLRDRLSARVDITTLDEWLERSEDYDVALRALYVAVTASRGQVTADVQAAMDAEAAAQARLPPDTRSMVLIMSEIGRGGMSASAVAIEQARSDLDEALAPPLGEPTP